MIGEKFSLPGVHVTRAPLAAHDFMLTSNGGSGGAVKYSVDYGVDRKMSGHKMF